MRTPEPEIVDIMAKKRLAPPGRFSRPKQTSRWRRKPVLGIEAGFRDPCLNQYIFLGNCDERTSLRWRLTAAAFLRLRSVVGFS